MKMNNQGEPLCQEEEKVRSHQSVDWWAYFKSIRTECPWSYVAYNRGLIDIVKYTGLIEPLGKYSARIYVMSEPNATVEAIGEGLDLTDAVCEWLWSYPGYGPWATPVPVLIQQNRQELAQIRASLNRDA